MRGGGTCARLLLVSCASAAATAIISPLFTVSASAMLTEEGSTGYPIAAPSATTGGAASGAATVPESPSGLNLGRSHHIIRRVDNPDQRIAFTFDACATRTQSNGFDRAVFQVLQRERVPATIFASGRWVEFHPGPMKELAAEPLIEFANHSYDHPHMDQLTSEAIAEEIDRTEVALSRYGRQSVAFRPPFGDFNNLVLDVARDRRLPSVLWDVVSGDPSARATADAMIRSVVRQTRAGSIIIFHINARETKTAEALPPIFRQLRARGFQFVLLSTLLGSGTPAPGRTAGSPVASPTVPPAARPPAPAAAAPIRDDADEVMPPSPAEGLYGLDPPEGHSLERGSAAPPVARARGRRRPPLSMGSATAGFAPPPDGLFPFGLHDASVVSTTAR